MIPKELLLLTESRALGLLVYGAGGLRKTNSISTLPPPILMFDWEGGAVSVLPWIRRRREWDEGKWTVYPDDIRQKAFDMVGEGVIKPSPYIDVISCDPMESDAYSHALEEISNLDLGAYNSVAIDPLYELSAGVQSFSKVQAGISVTDEIKGQWPGIQERTSILLRRLRSYRSSGIFIFLTCSEDVQKDYAKSQWEKRARGAPPPEPYSVKGTLHMPGKMPSSIQHLVDIQLRARTMSGSPIWVAKEEALPGGTAGREAKDRTGRLKDPYCPPNWRSILNQVYGEEGRKAIYAAARDTVSRGFE